MKQEAEKARLCLCGCRLPVKGWNKKLKQPVKYRLGHNSNGRKLSKVSIQKISAAQKGRKHALDARRNISIGHLIDMSGRKCSKCDNNKTYIAKSTGRPTWHYSKLTKTLICSKCYLKENRKLNREKVNASTRKWYYKNKKTILKKAAIYRRLHREEILRKAAIYRLLRKLKKSKNYK